MIVVADTARRTLCCDRCGYGISVIVEPEECPMCRSNVWVEVTRVDHEWLERTPAPAS